VRADFPARDLAACVRDAKSRPGGLSFGSSGNATSSHLAGALFAQAAGFELVHVPYRGGGPAVQDLLAGNIHWHMATVASALGHIQAGRLRALGTTHTARLATLPEVPTIAESGYPGYTLNEWNGLYAPAGTPEAVLDRLHAAALHALAQDAVKSRIETLGALTVGSPRAEFRAFVAASRLRMAQLVAEARIAVD
jgi:tripartite-type tricarboxylate transporter receptor subunit TctC